MNRMKLIADLVRDEGSVPYAYEDSEGYLTIGVGRLIDKRRGGRLSDEEILYLLNNDIDRVAQEARQFPWYEGLTEARQRVVLNMLFNLGLNGFRTFRRMIAALEAGDYEKAADEMANSKWCRQVGPRCVRLQRMMRHG